MADRFASRDMEATGISSSGGTLTGTTTLDCGQQTSDTPPTKSVYIESQGPYPVNSGGANARGFDLYLGAGCPTPNLQIVSNLAGAVNLTCYYNLCGQTSTVANVVLASGAAFALGTDDTGAQKLVTATNLAAAFNANATLASVATAATLVTGGQTYVVCTPKSGKILGRITSSLAGAIAVNLNTCGNVMLGGSKLALWNQATQVSDATIPAISSLSGTFVIGSLSTTGVNCEIASDKQFLWSGTTSPGGTFDSGFARESAGVIAATNAGTGTGDIKSRGSSLTTGTMTKASDAFLRSSISKFTWTNAQVVAACPGGAAGDITVCTLPAKTVVMNAYIVIDTAAGGPATLTVAVGRTAAAYTDYIAASDAKAAANTVYGDAVGERGANLTGYDLPSYTATTDVKAHFIPGDATAITTCTGTIFLQTMTLP